MPRPQRHRDLRPPGPNLDMFDPNNMPNHRDLGREERENPQYAWVLLVIIIAAILILA